MMKRLLALGLTLALLYPAAGAAGRETAGPSDSAPWTRTEGDGRYVTVRVKAPDGLGWPENQDLAVRYADTKQPVALTSDYRDGWMFATVPAGQESRPLEVFRGEAHQFPDCVTVWQGNAYYNVPSGADELYLRGVIQGDEKGNLNPKAGLTRAEAFALMVRLLALEPAGDPGYADVDPGDWYYDTASAARAAGIAAADTNFNPSRPVTRGEFTVMLARAMEAVGWMEIPAEADPADLGLADADAIPDWALGAYAAFGGQGIFTQESTGQTDPIDGELEYDRLAQWDQTATREEVISFIDNARGSLPWYPTQAAIDWGFDREMPVIDGSTSTYPYTTAVYGALFDNYTSHPQYPASHSKSHESYERLIRGEVDLLFAATAPSEALKAQAAEAGVELELIPIAYDAMVFFTNRENTITGLTMEQIQDIYVYGKYDNWSQVGGPDAQLLPYRRNADSGSHALMEHYFLEGGKLSLSPDVHNVLTSYAMSSALTDVADAMTQDPLAYAMGYSVYYYYQNSYWLLGDSQSGGDLKLLAVDGVLPTDQTIADGSYPLAGYNYIVLRSDTPEDAPARRMADFMGSEMGQSCVSAAGFGPLSNDAKADLEEQLEGWTVREVFPAGETGYMALAENDADGTLRGCFLTRGSDGWGPLTQADCPAPGETGCSAALVGGDQGYTMVFGRVGQGETAPDGTEIPNGETVTLRLTLADGGSMTQRIFWGGGGVFHFLLEEGQTPAALTLELAGRPLARWTDFDA